MPATCITTRKCCETQCRRRFSSLGGWLESLRKVPPNGLHYDHGNNPKRRHNGFFFKALPLPLRRARQPDAVTRTFGGSGQRAHRGKAIAQDSLAAVIGLQKNGEIRVCRILPRLICSKVQTVVSCFHNNMMSPFHADLQIAHGRQQLLVDLAMHRNINLIGCGVANKDFCPSEKTKARAKLSAERRGLFEVGVEFSAGVVKDAHRKCIVSLRPSFHWGRIREPTKRRNQQNPCSYAQAPMKHVASNKIGCRPNKMLCPANTHAPVQHREQKVRPVAVAQIEDTPVYMVSRRS